MSATKQSGPRRITHQEALTHYLALGSDRSLRKLRKALEDDPEVKTPCFDVISKWSKQYAWMRKAEAYDDRVAERVLERATETIVEQRVRLAKDLMANAIALNNAVASSVLDDKGQFVRLASGADFKAVMDAVEKAARLADQLAGGYERDQGKGDGDGDGERDKAIDDSDNVLRLQLKALNGG